LSSHDITLPKSKAVEYKYISHVPGIPIGSGNPGYALDEEGIFLLDDTVACNKEKIHREVGESLIEDPEESSYWVILRGGNRLRVDREAYERAYEYLKKRGERAW
jgi:hypothetical protein